MALLGSKLDLLKPEWLDVVFADRNKSYGAYELRKNNARNTTIALVVTVTLFAIAVSLPTIINIINGFIPKAPEKVKIEEVILKPPPPLQAQKTPPPPPPSAEPQRPKVSQVRFPPPVVKPDEQVPEKDPPTQKELEVKDPGQKSVQGDPSQTVRIDEPVGNAPVTQQVTEAPASNEIFTSVEVTPEFPGGMDKFYQFLGKAIRYPAVARENNVQGRVIVTFVVERDGSLTDVKALRGPGSGLDEEAVRAVKSSPKWRPGKQNGRDVRVQYTVPVVFTLQDEQ
ncbi:energy transducer TonB [Mucilaginibacter robiniae]|uniref:Energy transducer TonB n=1 Tax=Mucilaginibacter robiniae TaxID=2728022 RepID=A0A7L5DW36_9SPHI|nr:energy transducer TonB [Mucilaginibacter robiniae]QJD95300.1 energy transducer TonB [Mucilaginibacter robiniae]